MGVPAADLVASAVAATFGAVLADWLHEMIEDAPADLAAQSWRLLIALHTVPLR